MAGRKTVGRRKHLSSSNSFLLNNLQSEGQHYGCTGARSVGFVRAFRGLAAGFSDAGFCRIPSGASGVCGKAAPFLSLASFGQFRGDFRHRPVRRRRKVPESVGFCRILSGANSDISGQPSALSFGCAGGRWSAPSSLAWLGQFPGGTFDTGRFDGGGKCRKVSDSVGFCRVRTQTSAVSLQPSAFGCAGGRWSAPSSLAWLGQFPGGTFDTRRFDGGGKCRKVSDSVGFCRIRVRWHVPAVWGGWTNREERAEAQCHFVSRACLEVPENTERSRGVAPCAAGRPRVALADEAAWEAAAGRGPAPRKPSSATEL